MNGKGTVPVNGKGTVPGPFTARVVGTGGAQPTGRYFGIT